MSATPLPYDHQHNPNGVEYQNITAPALKMWRECDNMLHAAQTQHFAHVLDTHDVLITYIPRAGHFPATDKTTRIA